MVRGRVTKLLWAVTYLPTLVAQPVRSADTKPVAIFRLVVLNPLQWLSLRARHAVFGFKRGNDQHVRFHFGNDGHLPFFSYLLFGLAVNVAQIAHDNVGPPAQALSAIIEAGLEQVTLGNMCWREPTDDWGEPNAGGIAVEPQSQRMLLVANVETSVPWFEGTRP